MSPNYDVQQVCENGHQITCGFHTHPEEQKKFCPDCDAPTITSCPECGKEIQGAKIRLLSTMSEAGITQQRKTLEDIVSLPSYCTNCGEQYPWTKKRIQTAIQIFNEFGDLEEKEKETIEQDVGNIAKDLPETELSAMRIKRILKRCGNAGYEIIMELASSTAAKILKGPWL